MQCRPTRGDGKRYLDCRYYDDCLGVVGLKNWKSWHCEACDVFRAFFGIKSVEQKTENKRICESCHKRPTISAKHPYCASCLGALGRKKQLEKGLNTGEAKKPQEGLTETLRVDISVAIPKELLRLVFSSKQKDQK